MCKDIVCKNLVLDIQTENWFGCSLPCCLLDRDSSSKNAKQRSRDMEVLLNKKQTSIQVIAESCRLGGEWVCRLGMC